MHFSICTCSSLMSSRTVQAARLRPPAAASMPASGFLSVRRIPGFAAHNKHRQHRVLAKATNKEGECWSGCHQQRFCHISRFAAPPCTTSAPALSTHPACSSWLECTAQAGSRPHCIRRRAWPHARWAAQQGWGAALCTAHTHPTWPRH
jgi:hypothetical protein